MLIPVARSRSATRWRMEAFDLAEQFQTPVFVMIGPRPRHEQLDVRRRSSIPTSRSTAARCSTPETLEAARRVGPLQGRGRRRHPLPHAARRRHAGVLHARLRPQRRRRSTASGRTTTSRTWTGWRASSRRRASTCPKPVVEHGRRREDRLHRLRHVALGDRARAAISCASETDVETVVLPAARVSVHRRARGVHRRARARLRHRAEPRRPAAAADEAGAHAGAARRSCAACCTTTACRSTPAASPTMCWRRKASKWRRRRSARVSAGMAGGE